MPPRKKAKAADEAAPADVAEALKPVEMTSAELRRALEGKGIKPKSATARPALVKMLQEALEAGPGASAAPVDISQSEAPPREIGGRGGGRGRGGSGGTARALAVAGVRAAGKGTSWPRISIPGCMAYSAQASWC